MYNYYHCGRHPEIVCVPGTYGALEPSCGTCVHNQPEISEATAVYTGGGIYIYYGKLANGNYFRTSDVDDCIEIVDENASIDNAEADYVEFYEKHRVETLTGSAYRNFWDKMLRKIIKEKPEGNYAINELQNRL